MMGVEFHERDQNETLQFYHLQSENRRIWTKDGILGAHRYTQELLKHVGIFVFRGVRNFFRIHSKGLHKISIRMTLGTIQNDYFDYVRHV